MSNKRFFRPIVRNLKDIIRNKVDDDWYIQWTNRQGYDCFPMDIDINEIELVSGKYQLKNSGRFERFFENKKYDHTVVSEHINVAEVEKCINMVASITTGNWSLYIREANSKYCLNMFFINESDALIYKMYM